MVLATDNPNGNVTLNTYELDLDPAADRRSRGNVRVMQSLPGLLGGDQAVIIDEYDYDDGFGGCCGTNFVTRHRDGRGNETFHTYDAYDRLRRHDRGDRIRRRQCRGRGSRTRLWANDPRLRRSTPRCEVGRRS